MWEESTQGRIPYQAIIRECYNNQIGWLAWSWGPGNDPQAFLDMTEDSTYATLHDWGRVVAVTDTNSIQNRAVRPASIANSTPAPSPSPEPTPEGNLAMNQPVKASGQENSDLGPENAVDGDSNTRWASSQADPSWIYVDLGSPVDMTRVIIYWEAAYATQYRLEVSDDTNTWTEIHTEYNGDGRTDDIAVTGTGRYIRVYGMQRYNTEWGYSIWELAVYGEGAETPAPTAPGETPSPTPTPGPTAVPGSLRLQYMCGETNASTQQIKPQINIVNGTSGSIALSSITVRYYYSKEGSAAEEFHVDYAPMGSGNLTGSFQTGYLEVGFTSGAGSIPASGQTGQIQLRFNKSDWTSYDQSNDYSFDASVTSLTDYEKITLYQNGQLVWGIEDTGGTVPTEAPADTPVSTDVQTQAPTTPPQTSPGDVNEDGDINIVDALLVAQYYVGLNPSNFNQVNADTNCDSSINIVDALIIAQYYVQLSLKIFV
jgi:hypothetical protein